MVHSMDSMSAKWRDDPVRAALEKKQNRAAAADRLVAANAMAAELLQKRLGAGGSEPTSSRLAQLEDDEDPTRMNDADYRQLLDRQRQKLLGDDASSSSSDISVYDPFMSKKARREEKAERRDKERKREKKEKKEKKHKHKDKHKDKEKHKKEKRERAGEDDDDEDEERRREKKRRKREREREERGGGED